MVWEQLESNWRVTGEQLESNWRATGEQRGSNWRATGEQLESNWRTTGEQLESKWRASGEQVESKWRATGARLESNWGAIGLCYKLSTVGKWIGAQLNAMAVTRYIPLPHMIRTRLPQMIWTLYTFNLPHVLYPIQMLQTIEEVDHLRNINALLRSPGCRC